MVTDLATPNETEEVELVTIHPDIAGGIAIVDSRPFPNVPSALEHAQQLCAEERERCFLRRGAKVTTLDAAEAEIEERERA